MNGTDPNLDLFALDLSNPSCPKQVGKLIAAADSSSQFPTAVEETLEPHKNLKVFLAQCEKLHKVDPLVEKLIGLKNEIGKLR